MKDAPKSKNKMIYTKLFIPYYSNSKVKYDRNNYDISFIEPIKNINLKTDINSNSNLYEPKKIKVKKSSYSITPMRSLNAYEKANIESNITSQIESEKYQNILSKDKEIKNYFISENNKIKKDINQKKLKLKEDLNKIINESFSLENNIYNFRNSFIKNKIIKKNKSHTNIKQKNLEFLNSLGINIDFFKKKINYIDIVKTWNYIKKNSKGKNNIDDILRYKILNIILNLTRENRVKKINENHNNINLVNNNKKIIKKIKINNLNEIRNNYNVKRNYIPYNNNRLKMIEIINRSYNYTKASDVKNEF